MPLIAGNEKVFSEGNRGLLGRTLANNEETEKEETKERKVGVLLVLTQKPLFLWKKFSK